MPVGPVKVGQKRVLVIDLGAQCNTSLWLLGKRALRRHTEEPARTVTQAFRDKLLGTRLFRFPDAVIRGVPLSEKGYKLIPNLDLLPATVDLLEVEEHLAHKLPLQRSQSSVRRSPASSACTSALTRSSRGRARRSAKSFRK